MALSTRAIKFLETQERHSSTTDRDEILEAFKLNSAPVFEPLIEFQQKYSGYVFYAGLAPINLGLLQGDGGYPQKTGTSINEFFEAGEDVCKYHFICANTQYQMEFTLDEQGRYYEDCKVVASSFEKCIEHLSIWDQIKLNGHFKVLKRRQKLDIPNIDKMLGLSLMSEASDEYTLWFENEHIFMSQWNGLTTLIVSENAEKHALSALE